MRTRCVTSRGIARGVGDGGGRDDLHGAEDVAREAELLDDGADLTVDGLGADGLYAFGEAGAADVEPDEREVLGEAAVDVAEDGLRPLEFDMADAGIGEDNGGRPAAGDGVGDADAVAGGDVLDRGWHGRSICFRVTAGNGGAALRVSLRPNPVTDP